MQTTMMITGGLTFLADQPEAKTVRTTPADAFAGGLGGLLDRLAPALSEGEGVVLLDGPMARAVRLPSTDRERTTEGIDSAKAAGWMAGEPGAWTTFYANGRPTIVVGVHPRIPADRCPLISPWPPDSVHALAMWQRLTGKAWRGTPGVAGMTLLRELAPTTMVRGRPTKPAWQQAAGPAGAHELAWEVSYWSRPAQHPFAHGFDATRMYLAAAGACEVLAAWPLKNEGKRFDPRKSLAGWWRVRLGEWTDPRLPSPAGHGDPGERWVTTPTLVLLHELAEAARLDPSRPWLDFEVTDSWTGAGRRLLRRWADTLEGTYQAATDAMNARDGAGAPSAHAQDAGRVRDAVKVVYRETIGLLKPVDPKPGKGVYWPYNHYAIIAQARANLWRKIWQIGTRDDRWPIAIDVDNVWYDSPAEDPERGKPPSLPLVDSQGRPDRLGTFKPKGTRETVGK